MSEFRWSEAKSLFVGEQLGRGVARKTFLLRHDPSLVCKIESKAQSFQNVSEWETWLWLSPGKKSEWLAPCVAISACGSMLLQKRTQPVRQEELPKMVPDFLTDLKRENFGMLDGRIVCHDYGTVMSKLREASSRKVRADWRV